MYIRVDKRKVRRTSVLNIRALNKLAHSFNCVFLGSVEKTLDIIKERATPRAKLYDDPNTIRKGKYSNEHNLATDEYKELFLYIKKHRRMTEREEILNKVEKGKTRTLESEIAFIKKEYKNARVLDVKHLWDEVKKCLMPGVELTRDNKEVHLRYLIDAPGTYIHQAFLLDDGMYMAQDSYMPYRKWRDLMEQLDNYKIE